MSYPTDFLEPHGILSIHASAVAVNGRAWVFLGPSNTGKTTVCRLLEMYARPVADDGVYLVPEHDGEWGIARADHRAFRGPLSKEESLGLKCWTLDAVVRLYQAASSFLVQIDKLATCRYLTDAFFEIPRQRESGCETKQAAFSRLAVVARSVAGYELHFDRSEQAAEAFARQFGLGLVNSGVDQTIRRKEK